MNLSLLNYYLNKNNLEITTSNMQQIGVTPSVLEHTLILKQKLISQPNISFVKEKQGLSNRIILPHTQSKSKNCYSHRTIRPKGLNPKFFGFNPIQSNPSHIHVFEPCKTQAFEPKLSLNRSEDENKNKKTWSLFGYQIKQAKSQSNLNTQMNSSQLCQITTNKLEILEEPTLLSAEISAHCKESTLLSAEISAHRSKSIYSSIKSIHQQLIKIKKYIHKQIYERMIEMKKIFSQGNENSIGLVMLIFKQLQKQNLILKQKLAKMLLNQKVHSQYGTVCARCAHQITSSLKSNTLHPLNQKHKIKTSQAKGINFTTAVNQQQTIQRRLSPNKHNTQPHLHIEHSRVTHIESSNEQETSEKQSHEQAQSILVFGEHLDIIEEISDDDSESSRQKHRILCSPLFQSNTFSDNSHSSQLLLQNEFHTSSFYDDNNINSENINNSRKQNIKQIKPTKRCMQDSIQSSIIQFKIQARQYIKQQQKNSNLNNFSSIQNKEEDEQDSLIVKKLLKLKNCFQQKQKQANPHKQKISSQQITQKTNSEIKSKSIKNQQNVEQESVQSFDLSFPFYKICLRDVNIDNFYQQNYYSQNTYSQNLQISNIHLLNLNLQNSQNSSSISEALLILKDYNLKHSQKQPNIQNKNLNDLRQKNSISQISSADDEKILKNKQNIFNDKSNRQIKQQKQTGNKKLLFLTSRIQPKNRLSNISF